MDSYSLKPYLVCLNAIDMWKKSESGMAVKWLLVIAFIVQFGCGQQTSTGETDDHSPDETSATAKSPTIDAGKADSAVKTYAQYLAKGKAAAGQSQGLLLANIGEAIGKGGTKYAVEFCNVNAVPLVDSISSAVGMKIGRISTRFRNPGNKIKTQEDIRAWTYFINNKGESDSPDTVLYDRANRAVYYKPIRIGMETCLKCHGLRSKDIEVTTLDKIDELYPTDNAVNYRMGDLRGLWKVEFE